MKTGFPPFARPINKVVYTQVAFDQIHLRFSPCPASRLGRDFMSAGVQL